MSVAVEKLEGVASVRVSLEEGLAAVALEPGNALEPERIRELVRDEGFTPKEAEVRVRGRLVAKDGALAIAVTGLDREYRLVEHSGAPGRLDALAGVAEGTPFSVSGIVPETDASSGTERVLEVRAFSLEEP